MDRCALFVDAGYVLADGAMAVHGTRRAESVSWDYEGLLHFFSGLVTERTGLPLLRCYWYEATVDGRRTTEQDALADMPGIKLRVAKIRPATRNDGLPWWSCSTAPGRASAMRRASSALSMGAAGYATPARGYPRPDAFL